MPKRKVVRAKKKKINDAYYSHKYCYFVDEVEIMLLFCNLDNLK